MPIYRDYDQAALDAQYNLRARVLDHQEYFLRWDRASKEARATRRPRLDLRYDSEALDLFPAAKTPAPCLVFIHGGYWQAFGKGDFSFVAPAYQDAGVSVAVVDYTLSPKATMDEIVRQNRAAVAWLHKNARELGIDPDRVHVAGHSAGGHLTAMLLETDWRQFGLERSPVRGGSAISGLYDLEPIRLCYLNKVLGLDDASARRNSPILGVPRAAPPLILSLGTEETPEFLRQQADFAAAWRKAGLALEIADEPGTHHFSVMDRFAAPGSILNRAIMRQILA
ncbi:MAG TPA: alpha/beta hydrolase [Stellaceae bacterium]|nr:alpha/beta hydrolase [Stellaceae bacterium]